jgi:hypothetical protein
MEVIAAALNRERLMGREKRREKRWEPASIRILIAAAVASSARCGVTPS